jgi:hypothetical protein
MWNIEGKTFYGVKKKSWGTVDHLWSKAEMQFVRMLYAVGVVTPPAWELEVSLFELKGRCTVAADVWNWVVVYVKDSW